MSNEKMSSVFDTMVMYHKKKTFSIYLYIYMNNKKQITPVGYDNKGVYKVVVNKEDKNDAEKQPLNKQKSQVGIVCGIIAKWCKYICLFIILYILGISLMISGGFTINDQIFLGGLIVYILSAVCLFITICVMWIDIFVNPDITFETRSTIILLYIVFLFANILASINVYNNNN